MGSEAARHLQGQWELLEWMVAGEVVRTEEQATKKQLGMPELYGIKRENPVSEVMPGV